MSETTAALMATMDVGSDAGGCDLDDSGTSHHMSPYREDFVTFQEITPRLLTAVNQQLFSANGIGDIIINILYN